jgi:glycosyltransferase involved in cell wall biosynthesis
MPIEVNSASQRNEGSSGAVPISVLVMTFNEEANIALCLQTVAGWAREIFVVDSFSTDRTEEIAQRFPIKFIQHVYESAPAQWDWALRTLSFQNEWVLALDADFRVSAELKSALSRELLQLPPHINGIYVRHRQVFRGRFIKHDDLSAILAAGISPPSRLHDQTSLSISIFGMARR